MSDVVLMTLLFVGAMVVLTLEVFLPSHGVLTVVGIGILVAAIYRAFVYSEAAGVVSIVATMILLPTFVVVTVKIWPHTWIGRRVIPPNPTYTSGDFGTDVENLQHMIGATGKAVTVLKPTGKCEINGERMTCVCESGMLASGSAVKVVGVRGKDLEVTPLDEGQTSA